jgi:hypothetical protein
MIINIANEVFRGRDEPRPFIGEQSQRTIAATKSR